MIKYLSFFRKNASVPITYGHYRSLRLTETIFETTLSAKT